MPYTVHQAKTHFSRLLKAVEAGEEVIVMRGKKPVARLVPIADVVPTRKLMAGSFAGQITWAEGALDPATDEELDQMGLGYLLDPSSDDAPAADELSRKTTRTGART